jgi:hypothetical protein
MPDISENSETTLATTWYITPGRDNLTCHDAIYCMSYVADTENPGSNSKGQKARIRQYHESSGQDGPVRRASPITWRLV